jgi:hypothetical protein
MEYEEFFVCYLQYTLCPLFVEGNLKQDDRFNRCDSSINDTVTEGYAVLLTVFPSYKYILFRNSCCFTNFISVFQKKQFIFTRSLNFYDGK